MPAVVTIQAAEVYGFTARLTITVTGATAGATMTVYRVEQSREVPVLGARDVKAESNVYDDPVVDVNTATSWRVVLSTGESATTAGTLTIGSTYPILSEPHSGRFVPVVIMDMGERAAAQRGRAIDIEETADVVFLYDVESAVRFELRLLTLTEADRVGFLALVASGGPLLLRAACPVHRVGWFGRDGGERRSDLFGKHRPNDPRWVHTFASVVLVPEQRPDERPAGDTLGDLEAALPATRTLGNIAAQWVTLGAIAADDLRGA